MLEIAARKQIASALGPLAIAATELGICAVDFLGEDSTVEFASSDEALALVNKAEQQLSEYFNAERRVFDLPLDMAGTEFQRAVWNQIKQVEFGSTISYGRIAQAIGRPGAARAVGAAVGANPIPIIVPCHRVMGASGQLTGYSGGSGLPTKIQLLDLEGIDYR